MQCKDVMPLDIKIWLCLCLSFMFVKVITYGDAEEAFKKKENYILLCNHQSTGMHY